MQGSRTERVGKGLRALWVSGKAGILRNGHGGDLLHPRSKKIEDVSSGLIVAGFSLQYGLLILQLSRANPIELDWRKIAALEAYLCQSFCLFVLLFGPLGEHQVLFRVNGIVECLPELKQLGPNRIQHQRFGGLQLKVCLFRAQLPLSTPLRDLVEAERIGWLRSGVGVCREKSGQTTKG